MAENGNLYQAHTETISLSRQWGSRINEMMLLTHVALFVIFWMLGVYPMVWVNVGSIAIYALEFFVIKKDAGWFLALFISEVLLHMVLAIFFVGWGFGFQYYTFAMVPVVFFADHTVRKDGYKSAHPVFFSCVSILFFIVGRIISYKKSPIYPISLKTQFWAKNINGVGILLMLLIFSMVYIQRILEMENELVANAEFDELTKLPNRHYLDRLIEEEKIGVSGGIPAYALAILDIDNFKKVNDRFGHLAGDQVLKKLAGILARTASETEDAYAARWGGEEFMLLVTGEDAYEKLMELCEDVRHQLEGSVVHFDYWQIVVTASVGVAGTMQGMLFKDLTEEADKCLYEAKGTGKNRVIGKTESMEKMERYGHK